MNRSPLWPPGICSPRPLMRMRLPSLTPEGILTSMVSSEPLGRRICSGRLVPRAAWAKVSVMGYSTSEPRCGAGALPSASTAAAEQLLEDVGEVSAIARAAAEIEVEVFDADAVGGRPFAGASALLLCAAEGFVGICATAAGADAGVSELVIAAAFVGIGQDVVRFLHFLELRLSRLVVLVDVGVILAH